MQLRDQLINRYVQRESEITAALAALVSGEPLILVGPPGTAKTAIVEDLAKMVGGRYFYYLLTRTTEPDELLGPIDVRALREGKYTRIMENRLPTAHIVFLDEIFKGSSAIRNLLLDIILNRRIFNGGEYIKLPMLALYTASNEISTDAEDMAFYDRLVIRAFHGYVSEDAWSDLIDAGLALLGNSKEITAVMTVEDVRKLQEMARKRAMSLIGNDSIKRKYIEALALLKQKGIELSDRRKIKCLLVASAISLIYVEPSISLDSVAEALRFVAPHEPEDVAKVEEVIMEAKLSSVAEHVEKINAMIAELDNVLQLFKQNPNLESLKALRKVKDRVLAELKRMPKNPRLLPYVKRLVPKVNEAVAVLEEYRKEVFGSEE